MTWNTLTQFNLATLKDSCSGYYSCSRLKSSNKCLCHFLEQGCDSLYTWNEKIAKDGVVLMSQLLRLQHHDIITIVGLFFMYVPFIAIRHVILVCDSAVHHSCQQLLVAKWLGPNVTVRDS